MVFQLGIWNVKLQVFASGEFYAYLNVFSLPSSPFNHPTKIRNEQKFKRGSADPFTVDEILCG